MLTQISTFKMKTMITFKIEPAQDNDDSEEDDQMILVITAEVRKSHSDGANNTFPMVNTLIIFRTS